ncbi:MAG: hypothetical protein PWP66_365, partial [Thermosediminibacterales bacterium]|nr:hypothetical protein [Thermosediminibacterales bacterium]
IPANLDGSVLQNPCFISERKERKEKNLTRYTLYAIILSVVCGLRVTARDGFKLSRRIIPDFGEFL